LQGLEISCDLDLGDPQCAAADGLVEMVIAVPACWCLRFRRPRYFHLGGAFQWNIRRKGPSLQFRLQRSEWKHVCIFMRCSSSLDRLIFATLVISGWEMLDLAERVGGESKSEAIPQTRRMTSVMHEPKVP